MKWPNASAAYFSVRFNCCLWGCSLRNARRCCTENITGYFTKLMGMLVPESFLLPLKVDLNCTLWRLAAVSKDIPKRVLNGLGGYWHSGGSSVAQQHEVVYVGWLLNYLFGFPGRFAASLRYVGTICSHSETSSVNISLTWNYHLPQPLTSGRQQGNNSNTNNRTFNSGNIEKNKEIFLERKIVVSSI